MSVVTVVTAANENARHVTTVPEACSHTGLSESIVQALLPGVTDAFETYCNRVFAHQRYRERLAGSADMTLQLNRVPMIVDETTNPVVVKFKNNVVDSNTYEVIDTGKGWLYRDSGWYSSRRTVGTIVAQPLGIHQGFLNYEIEYTSGFIMPGEAGRNLPHDIEFYSWVALLYNARLAGMSVIDESTSGVDAELIQALRRIGLTRIRSGDTELSFPATGGSGGSTRFVGLSASAQQFPVEITGMLDRYKVWI